MHQPTDISRCAFIMRTCLVVCVILWGVYAAPPKKQKNKNEKYIVYPGLDVDNAAVATWMNGYSSPFNVVFGNQPYVVGWVGQEDQSPWQPFEDSEDYTYEDSYEKASSDTGVDVPHDPVIVDRRQKKVQGKGREKRNGLDFIKWPLGLNLVSLVGEAEEQDSWDSEDSEDSESQSNSGFFSKETPQTGDTGVDAPHDEVEADRGKQKRSLHVLLKPIEDFMDAYDVTIDAPHDHVYLDRRARESKSVAENLNLDDSSRSNLDGVVGDSRRKPC